MSVGYDPLFYFHQLRISECSGCFFQLLLFPAKTILSGKLPPVPDAGVFSSYLPFHRECVPALRLPGHSCLFYAFPMNSEAVYFLFVFFPLSLHHSALVPGVFTYYYYPTAEARRLKEIFSDLVFIAPPPSRPLAFLPPAFSLGLR